MGTSLLGQCKGLGCPVVRNEEIPHAATKYPAMQQMQNIPIQLRPSEARLNIF